MTDPYNSAGPYAPPMAESIPAPVARPTSDSIAGLDVSNSWKRRFRLIEKAGGPDLSRLRDLRPRERMSAGFNVLAFFFGPIYYLIKGLWRQAVVYLVCTVALGVLFELMGFGQFARAVGYGFAAVYAMRANVSYYRKVVLGDAPWF